ncbi:EAL domain-containing protein [Marinivivus vitaminiproducens]|uniref:EAL domain-containing protein n=1 Tax=Marinivivus vitaminiproducens TaxID=3035935 RepID=UPI0027A96D15|nr:EAL domain-containing protein [Geminicoccaceae bacterium SCSIO 64248]
MDLFARIVALMREAVIVIDPSGDDRLGILIAYANDAAALRLGQSSDALAGKPLEAVVHEGQEGREACRRLVAAAGTGEAIELDLPLRDADGREVACRVRGRTLGDPPAPYLAELAFPGPASALDAASADGAAPLLDGALYRLAVHEDGRVALAWMIGGLPALLGVGEAELIRRNGWRSFILPAERRRLQLRNQRLVAGEEATTAYTVRLPDGRHLRLRDRARPILDAEGDLVIGALGSVVDVTAEHEAAGAAAAARRDIDALARASGSVVCRLDADGRIIALTGGTNGVWARRLREGHGIDSGVAPADAQAWRAVLAGHAAEGRAHHVSFAVRLEDDSVERYEARVAAGGDGPVVLIRREEGLGAAELVDGLALPALLLGGDGRVAQASRALRVLLGRTSDSLRGARFADLFGAETDAPAIAAAVDRGLSSEDEMEVEAAIVAEGGLPVRLRWRFAPRADGLLVQALPVTDGAAVGKTSVLPSWQAMADASEQALVVIDRNGRIEAIGAAASALLGLGAGEGFGRSIASMLPSIPAGGLLAAEPGSVVTTEMRRRDGTMLPVLIRVQPMDAHVLLTLHDLVLERHGEQIVQALAFTDVVTGLPNRVAFVDRLAAALAYARDESLELAVLAIDLDGFRLLNTAFGLSAGNAVLREAAGRIASIVPDGPARLEGDRFLVRIDAGASAAERIAQEVLEALKPPVSIETNGFGTGYRQEVRLTACVGVACYPRDGDHVDLLIRNAESALEEARRQGPDRLCLYTADLNARAYERVALAGQLRRALDNGEFILHYQPQVDLGSGRVTAVEALLRWRRPDAGLIPPCEFLPVAEETGLIVPIGDWALGDALVQLQRWRGHGFPQLRLSVNLSAAEFHRDDLVRRIEEALALADLPPEALDLEIAEATLGHDVALSSMLVAALQAQGIGIVVDGFGTGGASLDQLRRFRPRAIKLESAFLAAMTGDEASLAVARSIVALAKSAGTAVVAEGIEALDDLAGLRDLGCDAVQGYVVSRPVLAAGIEELLSRPGLL